MGNLRGGVRLRERERARARECVCVCAYMQTVRARACIQAYSTVLGMGKEKELRVFRRAGEPGRVR